MRELLEQLQRELEARGCALDPFLDGRDRGHAIERGVHLDGVEMLRVERELVELRGAARPARRRLRIEDPVPRALARWIAPSGRADADPGSAPGTARAHPRYSSFLKP